MVTQRHSGLNPAFPLSRTRGVRGTVGFMTSEDKAASSSATGQTGTGRSTTGHTTTGQTGTGQSAPGHTTIGQTGTGVSQSTSGQAGATTTGHTTTGPTTTGHALAFGLIVGPGRSGREWVGQARTTEGQGFTSLLMPDTLWTPSPFPTLAAAAAVTSTLRLRTWVIAAPLRSPAAVVRESSALQLLSDGRFELGIGTGRPDAEREAELLGVPWGTAGERINQVEQVIAAVREKVQPVPQVIVTAVGPRMVAVAGRCADRVALALPPMASEQELHRRGRPRQGRRRDPVQPATDRTRGATAHLAQPERARPAGPGRLRRGRDVDRRRGGNGGHAHPTNGTARHRRVRRAGRSRRIFCPGDQPAEQVKPAPGLITGANDHRSNRTGRTELQCSRPSQCRLPRLPDQRIRRVGTPRPATPRQQPRLRRSRADTRVRRSRVPQPDERRHPTQRDQSRR